MTDWRGIGSAPMDGTCIKVNIPGAGVTGSVVWMDGLLDSDGNDCSAWCWMDETDPPDCWTDGICWSVNEDGIASAPPTQWKPERIDR